MNDSLEVDAAIAAILLNLSPSSRKKMLGNVSRHLRRSQQKRITKQQNPDGSAYVPRKRMRDRNGNLRGKMFNRMKMARNMKAFGTQNDAVVTFKGPSMRKEEVHQFGLRDRTSSRGPEIKYPARELLGFTNTDEKQIFDLIITLIAG
ncbi:phage virion morphogenesis protein [Serratia fonticola]|uniref:phage virion morphogenesis protein n=1 Tax=Serratia fonticola TaxID=47917 RepID=UPI001376763C|nr:phage virion morphogenesis protein [Serratia fonticola]NCG53722.1 phage virion morphogenesis protein [Serratia fonticola]